MDNQPIFIEPPAPPARKVDPRVQDIFDSCGTCQDCENMLEAGLVEN